MENTLGTNYYSVKRGLEDLDSDTFWERRRNAELGEGDDILHIGKSSGGWCFALHVIPDKGIHDLPGWVPFLLSADRAIVDEYRDSITYEQLLDIITNRRGRHDVNPWTQEMYERNYSEPGPNGLVRHTIGRGCVRHGAGTWDCCEGNYS